MNLLQHISLETAGIGGKLTHDYLNGKPEIKNYYTYTPDTEGLKIALRDRCEIKVNRQLLYDELHHQYAGSLIPEPVKENIHLLLQDNTYTITTGHQLNLFTGPLYFIYKIASIISLSKKLTADIPGYHFVPVYWMNSEDHDFAEINHFFMRNEKMEWKSSLDKFGPVGRMELKELMPLLEEITQKYSDKLSADPVFSDTLNTYKASSNLANAHRSIVSKLFGEYGVVILDQDSKAFKSAFKPVITNELLKAESIQHITETNSGLEKLGYKPQVFAREINLFYTGNNYRERIIKTDVGFELADHSKQWTKEQMIEELNQHPEFFGPNVVTRPLYQEFLLPNLAYVGGPAEIAYWLQYKSNFTSHGIFYPVLVLRDCFLLIPEKKYNKVIDLGLVLTDFFKRLDDLISQYVKRHLQDDVNMDDFKVKMEDHFDELLKEVVKIDASMDTMVNASRQRTINDIDKLIQKLNKSLKTKNETQLNHIKSLHAIIYPLNELQERLLNVFDVSTDTTDFIKNIIEHAHPLNAQLKVLTT